MSLPVAPNTTCDIYRVGNAPPAAPDVAGVPCFLRPAFHEGQEVGEGSTFHYSHVLLVATTVDIRDDNNGTTGVYAVGPNADTVWVPDQNGSRWHVMFVERVGLGTALDHKRAFLCRSQVTWPSDDL